MKLYRYRAISCREINTLRKNRLWLSLPQDFNDPFDCGLPINPAMSSKEAISFMNDLAEPAGYVFSRNQTTKNLILQTLANNANKRIRETGICCFSETWKSILMWSHYADKHKGLCIEYEIRPEIFSEPKKVALEQARYENDLPELRLIDFQNNPVKLIENYTLTKHKDWGYEKEWRILTDKTFGLVPSPFAITSIIFGLRTDEKVRSRIKRILGGKVDCFLAQRHPTEFCIEKIPC